MKKTVVVALWIVATLATTTVTYIAVTAAGAEVTDRPLTTVVAVGDTTTSSGTSTTGTPGGTGTSIGTTSSTGTTTSTGATGGTGTTSGTSTTGGSGTTGSTAPTSTSTTSTTLSTSTTSTTSPTSTTATTVSDAPWQQTTITSKGGLVVVSYRPGEVKLESVAPSAGFSYEIDEAGPPEVRVEFEGGDVKVEIRVEWDDGLVTEIDEN